MWGPNKIIKGTNQNAREETWMIPLNQERLRSWFLALRFLYPKRKLTQYHHLSQNSPSEILWTIIFGTWVRDPLIQYPLSLSLVDRMAMHIYFRNDEVCISFLLLLPVP